MKRTLIVTLLLLTGLLLVTGILSCRRTSSNAKRYELKGKVVAVEPEKHLVTIAHEEIKDYMPAMTMPFTVPDESAYAILRPGDQVSALLVVDGTQSWLEELVISRESPDTSADAASAAPVEAKAGDDVPDYGLVNQSGNAIKLHNYRGKVLVLTFIYTRCPLPEQCNLMSENFAALDQQLQKRPELFEKTHLLSVSFHPEYDTPAVLRSYGAAYTIFRSALLRRLGSDCSQSSNCCDHA